MFLILKFFLTKGLDRQLICPFLTRPVYSLKKTYFWYPLTFYFLKFYSSEIVALPLYFHPVFYPCKILSFNELFS